MLPYFNEIYLMPEHPALTEINAVLKEIFETNLRFGY